MRPPQTSLESTSPTGSRSITVDDEIVGGPSAGTSTLNGVALRSRQVRMWVRPRSDDVPIGMSSTASSPMRATWARSADGMSRIVNPVGRPAVVTLRRWP